MLKQEIKIEFDKLYLHFGLNMKVYFNITGMTGLFTGCVPMCY